MDATNYDRRSALHIAAAEGHIEILEYLLRTCQVIPNARDRFVYSISFKIYNCVGIWFLIFVIGGIEHLWTMLNCLDTKNALKRLNLIKEKLRTLISVIPTTRVKRNPRLRNLTTNHGDVLFA